MPVLPLKWMASRTDDDDSGGDGDDEMLTTMMTVHCIKRVILRCFVGKFKPASVLDSSGVALMGLFTCAHVDYAQPVIVGYKMTNT